MADHKLMYQLLFNSATGAIALLTEVQKKTENIYIENNDGPTIAALKD